MQGKLNYKRIWILLVLIVLSAVGIFLYKSYICAALLGAFSTLLVFSTIGQFLYRKTLQRQADREALKNQWNENSHPD